MPGRADRFFIVFPFFLFSFIFYPFSPFTFFTFFPQFHLFFTILFRILFLFRIFRGRSLALPSLTLPHLTFPLLYLTQNKGVSTFSADVCTEKFLPPTRLNISRSIHMSSYRRWIQIVMPNASGVHLVCAAQIYAQIANTFFVVEGFL